MLKKKKKSQKQKSTGKKVKGLLATKRTPSQEKDTFTAVGFSVLFHLPLPYLLPGKAGPLDEADCQSGKGSIPVSSSLLCPVLQQTSPTTFQPLWGPPEHRVSVSSNLKLSFKKKQELLTKATRRQRLVGTGKDIQKTIRGLAEMLGREVPTQQVAETRQRSKTFKSSLVCVCVCVCV